MSSNNTRLHQNPINPPAMKNGYHKLGCKKEDRNKDGEDSSNIHTPPTHNYNYCPLGRLELGFYFMVWIVHSCLAFILAARASSRDKVGKWLEHWMEPSDYLAGYRMDNSDLEWKLYRITALETVLSFALHSIVFHFVIRKLPKLSGSLLLIGFWAALHLYWTSLKCLLLLTTLATLTTSLTYYTRRQWSAWILCVIFVLKATEWAPFSPHPNNYFREFNLYLYTSVQILNFCIYLSKQRSSDRSFQFSWKLLVAYLEYLLYPIYSTTLIVLFEDFRGQLDGLRARIQANLEPLCQLYLPQILLKSLRLLFWFHFLDLILHICRVNAFFNSPFTMLTGMHNYEVASIAYVAGQLFHVKYVVIFGVPSLFAMVDGMQPPGPPICISRVSKYSQMWRYFDQGLYQFLKNQVYIPLMGTSNPTIHPTYMAIRRLLAMITVFLFVLSWHGITSNYFSWICLSAFELVIERIGREMIQPSVWWSNRRLSEANTMRVKALGMIFTVIPGIFGVFFFLGRTGVGGHIFEEVLVNGLWEAINLRVWMWNSGFVMVHLIVLGYCFNNVCLYLEERMGWGRRRRRGTKEGKRE